MLVHHIVIPSGMLPARIDTPKSRDTMQSKVVSLRKQYDVMGLEVSKPRPTDPSKHKISIPHKPQNWEMLQRHPQRIFVASFGIIERLHELKLLCTDLQI